MTREEAIALLNEQYETCKRIYDCSADQRKSYPNVPQFMEALGMALTALRPVSREWVEKGWRGEWVKRHKHRGGFRRVKGFDDMGEQHEVTIDERCEYDDLYCSKCGKQSPDNFLNFCGYCGAPMTDEAVDMVMERMEAMQDEAETV